MDDITKARDKGVRATPLNGASYVPYAGARVMQRYAYISLEAKFMGLYDYTDAQWDAAKEEMRAVLIAIAKKERTIPYSELTGMVHTIHFSPDDNAFHHMLDDISREEDAAGRGMLSVIVVHKAGDMMPGPGFFKLAKKLGRNISDREKCWSDELRKVYDNSK